MFQQTQNNQYLELCIKRVKNEYLTWVEQLLDIIEENNKDIKSNISLNDIGCNLGQFWKGLKRRKINYIEYNGFDFEEIYLNEAKTIFPEVSENLHLFDITKENLPKCDISVCSATLEHLDRLQPALNNILKSTNKYVLLRTFLGEISNNAISMKKNAKTYVNINQYSFNEVLLAFEEKGFSTRIVRDQYTDSLPDYIRNGIIRTFYIVQGTKK